MTWMQAVSRCAPFVDRLLWIAAVYARTRGSIINSASRCSQHQVHLQSCIMKLMCHKPHSPRIIQNMTLHVVLCPARTLFLYVTNHHNKITCELIVCSGFILKLLSVYLPLYGTETEKKSAIGLSSINQTIYHIVTVDLLLSYDMELDRNSYICLHIYIYGLILHYDMNLYFTKYRYCSKPRMWSGWLSVAIF